MQRLLQRLIGLCQEGEISEVQVSGLVELTQMVLKQITRKLGKDEREDCEECARKSIRNGIG